MAMRVISNNAHPILSALLYNAFGLGATEKAYFAENNRYFSGKDVMTMLRKRLDSLYFPKNAEVFDPLGSYTGLPYDPVERPVQDADDL